MDTFLIFSAGAMKSTSSSLKFVISTDGDSGTVPDCKLIHLLDSFIEKSFMYIFHFIKDLIYVP